MNQKGFTNKILVIIIIILVALIAGSGTYFWQKPSNEERIKQFQQAQEENQKLQERVNELQNQIARLQTQAETEKAIGYIKTVYESGGKRYLDIDYVQWLTGDEAIIAIMEDGECPLDIYTDPSYCIPNGVYIRNQDPKIRNFEISNDAEIIMQTYASGKCRTQFDEKVSYTTFKSFWEIDPACSYLSFVPYNIEIQNDVITKITEQYIP